MKTYALSLSSSTYKNHIFEGFSRLQQNDEFVDMTLAADGHWVKVHRTLVALASPYFRELLQSLPCQHPMLYLYGVSHEALGFILEYLYTGQVEVPPEKVQTFLKTAKDMQIAGLKNVVPPDECEDPRQEKQSKHGLHTLKEQPSTSSNFTTKGNEKNNYFKQQVPIIAIPAGGIEKEENKKLSFPVHVPIPLDGTNTFANTINIEPNNLIKITLDETAATHNYIREDLQSNDLENMSNTNEINNVFIDQYTNIHNDINQNINSNELPNIESINAPNKMINITLDESVATNSNIKPDMRSKEFQSVSNMNATGKTINITVDESVSNDTISQKPVAQIEILSNTLHHHPPSLVSFQSASRKYTKDGVNINDQEQSELPELYAQALAGLANMNNQDMSSNHETDSVKCTNKSLMDISQLLDFRDDVPMDVNNDSNLMETQAGNKNDDNGCISNSEQIDLTILQDTDSMLYTLSNRGALQLIMNRFMYYCHYQQGDGRKRRWRCIDYRDAKCLAAIDTNGERIVERKHAHCHPNHMEKIRRKIARKKLKYFDTIQMAQDFMEIQKSKTS